MPEILSKLRDLRDRGIVIASQIAKRYDMEARAGVAKFRGVKPDYSDLNRLMISEEAWSYINRIGIDPQKVFAHPDVFCQYPATVLYYRGMALLPLKGISEVAVAVDKWESADHKAVPKPEGALEVARACNYVNSGIITSMDGWTLDDGWRNILATIGITQDGSMRNRVGKIAEKRIQHKLLEWLQKNRKVTSEVPSSSNVYLLARDCRMTFSSDPDIKFEKRPAPNAEWNIVATIEIKGGRDPAGALERLGAVQKSFEKTPRAKNFLIAGVVTEEMERRLSKLPVEKHFLLDALLDDEKKWLEFLDEIFHHTVRIVDSKVD